MTQEPILDRIVRRKKEEVAASRSQTGEAALLARATEQEPVRGFHDALVRQQGPAIIAEIKRASPSRGIIHPADCLFDPGDIAEGYARHGAACISCLTDRDFFQGELAFLPLIRGRMALPVLRKDFLLDPYQVIEARAFGADAILLIMAMLSHDQALELEDAARQLNLDVLVEVHDEEELEQAHRLRTPLLGINNRNLKTFQTSLETSVRLAQRVEPGRLVVAESGIHTRQDLQYLQSHGMRAFLIGEQFMRDRQPGQALARLLA